MKILQTVELCYPFIEGGAANYVYSLSRELAKRHDVSVICSNEPKSKYEEDFEGIKFKRVDYLFKLSNTNISLGLPFALNQEEFDIIHTHLPHPYFADISALIGKLKKRPVVLTYHNDITGDGLIDYIAKMYNSTFLKVLLNNVERIIVTQESYIERSRFLKKYKDKIDIIPVGVDTNRFRHIPKNNNTDDKKVIFFLSHLDEYHRYKGLDYLLKALKLLKSNINDFKLIVGGRGKLVGEYKSLVKNLGLEKHVEFHGFIPDEKLVNYYNLADVFVLPSISNEEGFGMVALEALACKTPVVVTDIVGVSNDLIKYNAGLVVKPRDVESLSKSLIMLLEDPESRFEMGENGRDFVERKYTWKRVAKMTEKIYEDVL